MKRLLTIMLFIVSILTQAQETMDTTFFRPDTVNLIRNPGMGWTIYDDANDAVANADDFWTKQDSIARKYASVLYIRWRWSDMEPEEGKYAWIHDTNFKRLVQGALDRGLRLAFRIYVSGQDNLYEATPAFVFEAGAQYYMEDGLQGKVRSPYPDDTTFQQKFENFIHAFAAQYDRSEYVDYIDAYNLGWWGEGDNLRFMNWSNRESTFSWIINLYGKTFRRVPLVIAVDSQIGHHMELKYAIEKQGYAIRRDGYASFWMPERQHKLIRELFPQCFVISECCYWQDRSIESVNQIDKKYQWNSWGEYYEQVLREALATHANYLDLREPVESQRWVTQAPHAVFEFIQKGGYRIYPISISNWMKEKKLLITHTWKNTGVGVLPNNNKRWNYKYKVAFGLINERGALVKTFLSENAEPSDWIGSIHYSYQEDFSLENMERGYYKLVVGIIDSTQTDALSFIHLAVEEKEKKDNWVEVGHIKLHEWE